MLTVHHLNNSRSQRVLWLLEELGTPYEIIRYNRQPNMLAPPELRAIHPLGKSPVITDNGNTIAESGAIVEYLVKTYGNGRLIPPTIHRSACASPTGCTMPRDRRCRRYC
jgi:glutathione S-transferase